METIFASRFRRSPKLDYNRECLIMPDGGTVAVDFEPTSFDQVSQQSHTDTDVSMSAKCCMTSVSSCWALAKAAVRFATFTKAVALQEKLMQESNMWIRHLYVINLTNGSPVVFC